MPKHKTQLHKKTLLVFSVTLAFITGLALAGSSSRAQELLGTGKSSKVEPFTLESTSQFRTKGPDALTSRAYARDYNEVKDLGAATTPRTPAQTVEVLFYTVHPPELFNRTFRVIAEAQRLTLAEEARLFAMLNVAAADSLINCFDDKGFWNFWRPVTAIQEGDKDGNRRTAGTRTCWPLSTRALACARLESSRTWPERNSFCRCP